MGGPMKTHGHVSFKVTDAKRAKQIRDYFVGTIVPAMRLSEMPWYNDDEAGWGFEMIDDIQRPETHMMIVFGAWDVDGEVDLSPSAVLLNEKFKGIDAVYTKDGSEW